MRIIKQNKYVNENNDSLVTGDTICIIMMIKKEEKVSRNKTMQNKYYENYLPS